MNFLNSLKTGMLITTRGGETFIVLENPQIDGSIVKRKVAIELNTSKKDLFWLELNHDSYTENLLDANGEAYYDICIIEDMMNNDHITLRYGNILYFNSDIALRPSERGYLETALYNGFDTVELLDSTLCFKENLEDGSYITQPVMRYSMGWLERLAAIFPINIQELLNGTYNRGLK